jgi:methionyl-tRNA formyltransferase
MRAVVFAYSNVGDRCLRVLRARGVEVPLVVTHADTAGETVWFARVADTAQDLDLPFVLGDDPRDPALHEAVAAAAPDVLFSFYYRSLLPAALLDLAPRGAFNMHGSLLPKYRGRAPTNWAVLNGETETGATLHQMLARADAGGIVDQQSVPILPDDTGQQVFDKVTVAAEQVLWRSVTPIASGGVRLRPNDIAQGSTSAGARPRTVASTGRCRQSASTISSVPSRRRIRARSPRSAASASSSPPRAGCAHPPSRRANPACTSPPLASSACAATAARSTSAESSTAGARSSRTPFAT